MSEAHNADESPIEGAHWQLQDAKQRFSAVVRAAHDDGPQVVTRHGQEVAVVVDAAEYRRMHGQKRNFVDFLLSAPKVDGFDVDVERGREFPRDYMREVDFGDDIS